LPVLVALALVLLYNYLRFQNPFQQGYSYQDLPPGLKAGRDAGMFSFIHLPANLFYALLSTPLPVFRDSLSHVLAFPYIQNNPWGMSIFVTSPYLLYLFLLRKKDIDLQTRNILIAVGACCLMIFTYYGMGWYQFGYRYSLDFMPLLFLLFMTKYRAKNKKLSSRMQILLLGAGIFNFYLLLSYIVI
jgi:hypothetical protein